jgi:hypothetical protein
MQLKAHGVGVRRIYLNATQPYAIPQHKQQAALEEFICTTALRHGRPFIRKHSGL